MKSRRSIAVIVFVTFVIWMGSRATAIALPLVALAQTGRALSTGLVLGAQALPMATAGLWAARLRERIVDARAVAFVMIAKSAGLSIVPILAMHQRLGIIGLVLCGLVVGATSALDGPGLRAILSDLGDHVGAGSAARALTLQDLAHRCTMFLAPPLAAVAVGRGHTVGLLWAECLAVAASAGLLASLTGRAGRPPRAHLATGDQRPSPASRPGGGDASMVGTLRGHPRMTASMSVSVVASLTWFAFSLGLAIAGAREDRPGELIAAGMAGYGVASTAAALAAPFLVNRLPVWPTAVLPTAILGVVFLALPAHPRSLGAIGLLAALGGATMPIGIAAHNRILATDPPAGSQRRAAFAADQIADGSASSVGMLFGGGVIGLLGVGTTLTVAGVLQLVAVAAALAWQPRPKRTPGSQPVHLEDEGQATGNIRSCRDRRVRSGSELSGDRTHPDCWLDGRG